eukprot:4060796-Pyramimonas_sp.AAC.1
MLRSFVDDAVVRVEGAERQSIDVMIEVGSHVCELFHQAGFVVRDKTVVLGCAKSIASQVAEGLRRTGTPVTSTKEAADLGMDTAAGGRRSCRTANERMAKAKKQSQVIRRMRGCAKLRSITSPLWAMRARPQIACARQPCGLPGHVMMELRRQAAQCSVGLSPGRCLTALLAMVFMNKDPANSMR